MTNQEILKAFLNGNCSNLAETTINQYTTIINEFFEAVDNKDLSLLTPFDLEKYKIYLINKKYESASYNKKIVIFRKFMQYIKYLKINNNIDFEALKIIFKTMSKSNRLGHGQKPIPPERYKDFVRFLLKIKGRTWLVQRKKVISLLLATTGLRRIECLNLKKEDIDLEKKTINPSRTKGNKERVVYLAISDAVAEEIKLLYKLYDDNGIKGEYVLLTRDGERISSISEINILVNAISQMAMRRGLITEAVAPHGLRKSYAVFLRWNPNKDQRLDIEEIRDILGHSTIVTTEIYTQLHNEKTIADVRHIDLY